MGFFLIMVVLVVVVAASVPFVWEDGSALALIGLLVAAFLLVNFLVMIPIHRNEATTTLLGIEATRATVAHSRENNHPLEQAALTHKIIEANNWVSSAQYWSQHWFFWVYWPAEVQTVQPIR